jgi:hypothetical protein
MIAAFLMLLANTYGLFKGVWVGVKTQNAERTTPNAKYKALTCIFGWVFTMLANMQE